MKCCEKCEHYFGRPTTGSPCEKCVNEKWGKGFQPAGILTRIRILKHRLGMIVRK